jgi:hypothetical protein
MYNIASELHQSTLSAAGPFGVISFLSKKPPLKSRAFTHLDRISFQAADSLQWGQGRGLPSTIEKLTIHHSEMRLMSSQVEIPRCQHIKVNGIQCGSPALRTKKFCYFHYEWRKSHRCGTGALARGRRNSTSLAFELPPLEDANSIQLALMQVTGLLLSGRIDHKTAGLVLYALQTASSNLRNLALEPDWQKVVVNPRAVRHTPIELTDEQLSQQKENELLCERLKNAGDPPPADTRQKKPCATWSSAVQSLPLHSRHYLPTSPQEWEELRMSDFTAYMMSTGSFMLPPETFQPSDQQRTEDQRLTNLEKTS